MNPFYFPFVTGSGNNLQGYFDLTAPTRSMKPSSQPIPPMAA